MRLAIRVIRLVDRLSRITSLLPRQSTEQTFYEPGMIDVESDLGKRIESC
jgi:hypothetical protein